MSGGYWDIHNHILPGLDDGSGSMEETIELLAEEYRQGVRNIVFTPHHRPKMFRVSIDDREMVYRKVCLQIGERFPDMHVYLGCEFYVHEKDFDVRELEDPRCRLAGSDTVLVEFSRAIHFADLKRQIEDIIKAGYRPILAHGERYHCLYQTEQRLEQLRKAGVLIQLNAGSILGKEGPQLKRFCVRVLQSGLADLIASDAHGMERRPVEMAVCIKKLQRKFGKEKTDWWTGGVQRTLFGNP